MRDSRSLEERIERHTVGGHLVALHAVLARKTCNTGLLVDLGRDGVFTITEDALELGIEAVALWFMSAACLLRHPIVACLCWLFGLRRSHTFFGPAGLAAVLRLPWRMLA